MPDDLPPPSGFSARPPTLDDFHAVLAMIIAADIAELGEPDYDEAALRDDWKLISLEHDARILLDDAGAVAGVGVATMHNAIDIDGHVYVSPAHHGRGVGTWLTRWTERRARERVVDAPEGARVTFTQGTLATNEASCALLEHEGYEVERYFLRMLIELDAPPPAPVLPAGIEIRAMQPGEEHAVYEAIEDSFSDHWGHVPRSFESFRERSLNRETFDPSLWFVAHAGDDVAAISLCSVPPDVAWVNTLGVRRPWRRSGLGLALLYHSFGEIYRRGQHRIVLGVDAQSLTGATRLYERAGMRPQRKFALYRKELRAGVDLATRELTA